MTKVLKFQFYHLITYIILTVIIYFLFSHLSGTGEKIMGLSTLNWIILSWAFAFLHQFWIVLFWRLELYKGVISRSFSNTGFTIYRAGFITFSMLRLLPIIPVSYLAADSMSVPPVFRFTLIIVSTPLILWAVYSVIAYFGINRAFGADHFFPEYRSKSLEMRGTFKYIPNSMYTILLLVLYHPGLLFNSFEGLLLALIHHAYVWTHYFCTEKPDMKEIYGK